MDATQTAYMMKELADCTVRGFALTTAGEIAVVFDGGRMLVGKNLRVLSQFESERILADQAASLSDCATTLHAASNVNGHSAQDRLAARREETVRMRDEQGIRKRIYLTDVEEPEFLSDYQATPFTPSVEIQRRARSERIKASVPEVH